ncbi:hypothetical protein CN995_01650 [Bacillus cereus]|uniref:hypothetical protein n=1 Tax=Bacillus TaxID=1386 RepID=UPI000BECAEBA|nr:MULTISPECIES: hypothetical protein [Bacillus cereus group]MCU5519913.1 hypothetical protein [Bacillus cereus]MDA2051629.1 hypothetical protein [Bacillus cereus]PEE94730.1 hypothetical protein COM92_10785 [Bacillus cereus]PGM04049.1 hypothetical protein CN942_19730 [Bacillus thuringiensis]PGN67465.1 hypothetical protein CN967_30665 [Bacillus cereus]
MKFVERPFYNIKEFDFGAVAWTIIFFVAPMVFWVIPAQARMGLTESMAYLFSLDFYTETTVSTNMLSQIQNKTSYLLNIGKVVVWILSISALLIFLFKKPKALK